MELFTQWERIVRREETGQYRVEDLLAGTVAHPIGLVFPATMLISLLCSCCETLKSLSLGPVSTSYGKFVPTSSYGRCLLASHLASRCIFFFFFSIIKTHTHPGGLAKNRRLTSSKRKCISPKIKKFKTHASLKNLKKNRKRKIIKAT